MINKGRVEARLDFCYAIETAKAGYLKAHHAASSDSARADGGNRSLERSQPGDKR